MAQIILYILMGVFIIGAIDWALGGPLKLRAAFVSGMMRVGVFMVLVFGLNSFMPVVTPFLKSVFVPLGHSLGMDPSAFTALFSSPELGGYTLCMSVCDHPMWGEFFGLAGAVILFMVWTPMTHILPAWAMILSTIPYKCSRRFLTRTAPVSILGLI